MRILKNQISIVQREVKILLAVFCVFFSSCHITKFVPEQSYLLNDVKIKVEDTKDVSATELMKYVQQKQDTEILGFWKLQLGIYNTASLDTAKWTSKNARKIGEAPVLFSADMAQSSCNQLKRAMNNKGYFRANVDTLMQFDAQKVDVLYQITANEPYFINDYRIDLPHDDLAYIAQNKKQALVHSGMQFDADILNQERQRVASMMRRRGYFYFDQEYLQYKADSIRKNSMIDVQMVMQDYIMQQAEAEREKIFRKYTIARVHLHIDYDPSRIPEDEEMFSSMKDGYVLTWVGQKLMRDKVLLRHCPIKPGDVYNEAVVERAYARLNQLAPVKYVDISFEQISATELDCHVVLSRGKLNSVSTEVQGTYSAGDWGVAAGASYSNKNLFKGAEELKVDGRASYEWRQNGGRAIEAKASAGLKFSTDVAVDLAYNFQNRPDEYKRNIFSAGLNYQLRQPRAGLQHQFRFLDVSYVYLPWISDAFKDQFLQSTNILKYSYENHFIVGLGYSGNYTTFRARQPHRSYWNLYYNIETAGNLLQALAKPCRFAVDSISGKYMLFNTQFSQFAKADLSVTYNQMLHEKHRLVWHADVGVAVPYGNSQTIPFEKRYFAGGANSVRGWSARSLGPGGYKGTGKKIDFNNQSGDIRLNMSLEYRAKVWSIFELAAFVDAGNVWTIYEYDAQPYGAFKWSEFYKQLALAYGVGVRFDLSFFIFRVDFGVKLYDPSRLYDGSGTQWRTVPNGLNWKEDMAFHFAIGYPF